ncbi:hypothetical protein V5799_010849 [Amblyomma americanum]|uniref:Helitron helicase-like domain-containing protein n=1 Tax=Amblyomma americanum TaxID=6943 RepID=A0AAQ4EIN7_AMBAM
MKVLRHRVSSEITMMYRNNDTTRHLARQDVENHCKVQQFIEQDIGVTEGVPNTVQYWQKRKSELFAMIRQLVKPTVFLTLSASEVHWSALLKLLEKLRVKPSELGVDEDEGSWQYAATLVNNDPATCYIHFEHMVRKSI